MTRIRSIRSDIPVAVLFRGAIRPNPVSVANNMEILLDSIRQMGLIPITYLATWTSPKKITSLLDRGIVDNIVALREFSDEEIFDAIKVKNLGNGVSSANVFRQFYMARQAIGVISADCRHDYIVHSRTDMEIRIDVDRDIWFTENYCTIHTRECAPGSFVNDQFGVAPSAIMRSVWDYQSLDRLSSMISLADKPEDVLQAMIDDVGVRPVRCPCTVLSLDPRRHENF
jgi:hypothetical protein